MGEGAKGPVKVLSLILIPTPTTHQERTLRKRQGSEPQSQLPTGTLSTGQVPSCPWTFYPHH